MNPTHEELEEARRRLGLGPNPSPKEISHAWKKKCKETTQRYGDPGTSETSERIITQLNIDRDRVLEEEIRNQDADTGDDRVPSDPPKPAEDESPPRPVFIPSSVDFKHVRLDAPLPTAPTVKLRNDGGEIRTKFNVVNPVGSFWRFILIEDLTADEASAGIVAKFEISLDIPVYVDPGFHREVLRFELDDTVGHLPIQARLQAPTTPSSSQPKPPPTSVPPRTAHRGSPKPNKPKPSVKTPASKASASSGSSPHENTFVQMYAWFVVMALAGIYIWLAGHFDAHSDELAAEPDLKGADLKDIEHFNQILEFRPAVISIAVVAVALGLLEAFAVSRQAHQGLILLLGVADACVSFSAGFIAVGLGYMWPYSITLSKYGLTSGWWLLFNLAGIVGVIIGGILLIAWWVFCVYNLVVAVGDALGDDVTVIAPSARPTKRPPIPAGWRKLDLKTSTNNYADVPVPFFVALWLLLIVLIVLIALAIR